MSEKAEKRKNKSALDGVDYNLPALAVSQTLQEKAAKVGFEWSSILDILDKLEEEIQEMREAIDNKDKANQAEELGDILFLLSNYGRNLGINSEEALHQCNRKFERRFRGLETDLKNQGSSVEKASLSDMEHGWNVQKAKEKQRDNDNA